MDPLICEEKIVGRVQRTDLYETITHPVKKYVREVLGNGSDRELYWMFTHQKQDLKTVSSDYSGIANMEHLNDIQNINEFLEKANQSLKKGQTLVVCMETKDSRHEKIINKFPKLLSYPYYIFDFIVKRVFPKWKPTQRIYFWFTQGRNHVLSLTEGLGRLVSCGFSIIDYKQIGYKTYIICKKDSKPVYDKQPTYGILVRLQRVGKGGRLITVFKLRTMHPYSEYLQDFMFKRNFLQKGGKIQDDFRVTGWGKIFRKLWIDELPMLYNWLRGDLKLVGVRPLSEHYFSLYPKKMQQLRTLVKPGLLPPFYADMPETFDEIVESERAYLEGYMDKPILTDLSYFFKAVYNILIMRERSA